MKDKSIVEIGVYLKEWIDLKGVMSSQRDFKN